MTLASHTPHTDARIERQMHVAASFPSSISGSAQFDLRYPGMFQASAVVKCEGGEVRLSNFIAPVFWHSITVQPREGKARVEKRYQYADGTGQPYWST